MDDAFKKLIKGDLHDIFMGEKPRPTVKWHHYFPVYEHHLKRFKDKAPTLVEIGVAGGGSLHIWRKYFGPKARIIGVDINEKCKNLEKDGFEIIIGDQSDPKFLKKLAEAVKGADIIIDDGGHTSEQNIRTFEFLYPVLKEYGVYIAEDLHTAIWPRYVDRVDGSTFLDTARAIADRLTWWHITPNNARYKTNPAERTGEVEVPYITRNTWSVSFYDSMVAFEKRPIPEPWNDRR